MVKNYPNGRWQVPETNKIQRWLSANRLFYSINGGIVVGFWVALGTFIQPAWLHPQPGWTVPAGGLGFVFGTVGSSLLYRPKER